MWSTNQIKQLLHLRGNITLVFWFSDRQERWSGSDCHVYLINVTVDQPLSENSIARGRVGGGPIVIRYSNTCLKSFRTPSLDSEGMLRGTDNFYFIPLICNGIEYSSTIAKRLLESLLLPQPWYDHSLQRHVRLQVYQEPPSDRRVKEIWTRHVKNNTIDEIQTSKQSFSQQTQRRHQTHKTKLLIAADKTTNFYELEPSTYNDLLKQNITKSYKKAQPNTTRAIHSENKNIATKRHRWQGGHHSYQRRTHNTERPQTELR